MTRFRKAAFSVKLLILAIVVHFVVALVSAPPHRVTTKNVTGTVISNVLVIGLLALFAARVRHGRLLVATFVVLCLLGVGGLGVFTFLAASGASAGKVFLWAAQGLWLVVCSYTIVNVAKAQRG